MRFIVAAVFLFPLFLFSCATPEVGCDGAILPCDGEKKELVDLCKAWLDDYSNGRLDRVEALFAPGAVVAIDAVDTDRQAVYRLADFMARTRKSLAEGTRFSEWLTGDPVVLIDHKIACVWAPYLVESTGRKAEGIDVFQFIKLDGAWRLACLSYTNRKVEPQSDPE